MLTRAINESSIALATRVIAPIFPSPIVNWVHQARDGEPSLSSEPINAARPLGFLGRTKGIIACSGGWRIHSRAD